MKLKNLLIVLVFGLAVISFTSLAEAAFMEYPAHLQIVNTTTKYNETYYVIPISYDPALVCLDR